MATNREWLNTLSDEEYSKELADALDYFEVIGNIHESEVGE